MTELKFEHGRIYKFTHKTLDRKFNKETCNYVYEKHARIKETPYNTAVFGRSDWDEKGCSFEFIEQRGKMYTFREIHGLWTRTLSINQLIGWAIFVLSENGNYELLSI